MFICEIEMELLEGRIDMVIYSFKDLLYQFLTGLVLTVFPEWADLWDVLIFRDIIVCSISDLLYGVMVVIGSLWRKVQLFRVCFDFHIIGICGNVDIRLWKVCEGYDGMVVIVFVVVGIC